MPLRRSWQPSTRTRARGRRDAAEPSSRPRPPSRSKNRSLRDRVAGGGCSAGAENQSSPRQFRPRTARGRGAQSRPERLHRRQVAPSARPPGAGRRGGWPRSAEARPTRRVGRGADCREQPSRRAEEAVEEPQVLVPHRPAGKRLTIAAVAAGVLFVGAAGVRRARRCSRTWPTARWCDTKLDVARTAANAITTLWTYTPDNMESLPDRSATLPWRRLRQRVPQVHRRDRRPQQAGAGHQHHRGDGRGGGDAHPDRRPPRSSTPTRWRPAR